MRDVLTTVLELVGFASVVIGVAFIFWPAAFVVGGAGLIWASWRMSTEGVSE